MSYCFQSRLNSYVPRFGEHRSPFHPACRLHITVCKYILSASNKKDLLCQGVGGGIL